MVTLLDFLFGVQPDRPHVARIAPVEPFPVETGPTLEPEPFMPSAEDLAYDLAFAAARIGEPARFRGDSPLVGAAHIRGTREGTLLFEAGQARRLGFAMGYECETGISEPPAGFAAHEASAYREGFAAGVAEFESDREFEAWVSSREMELAEVALSRPIADHDIYRPGCVS
jgi:hypothetical protein